MSLSKQLLEALSSLTLKREQRLIDTINNLSKVFPSHIHEFNNMFGVIKNLDLYSNKEAEAHLSRFEKRLIELETILYKRGND